MADKFGGEAQSDLLGLRTVDTLLSTGGMKVESHQMQIRSCSEILVLESRVPEKKQKLKKTENPAGGEDPLVL